ncbi:MAG: tRNA (guanosine(37)-N1)-methyltransferase TrmD, partial [Acetobacterium sp.]|nr:tRNA (guanosine(37)-N1)-methyltransferase TrmD [Acetobacterium sp.]
PHYTKPREFEGQEVPEILLSGNHAEINKWRLSQAEARTRLIRPDLFEKYESARKEK